MLSIEQIQHCRHPCGDSVLATAPARYGDLVLLEAGGELPLGHRKRIESCAELGAGHFRNGWFGFCAINLV